MSKKGKIITTFHDLKSADNEETLFFFLDHLLKARIDLHMETGENEYEEEINMYVANLLQSVLTAKFDVSGKPYLSPFDIDVRRYVKEHPGLRNEYLVYKENADFGLISENVFLGFHHDGSYHDRVMAEGDTTPRIANYYIHAASALGHLRGMHETLVQVLFEIGQQIREIATIIRKAAGDYFDFIERISAGSLYHLQKSIAGVINVADYRKKIDHFLLLFEEYKEKATEELKQNLIQIVRQIKEINPEFGFNEAML